MHGNVSVRLIVVASAFLPWLLVYLLAKRGISVKAAAVWLRGMSVLLFAISTAFFVFDHTRTSTTLNLYFWGLFLASNWIRNHYKLSPFALTSLTISRHSPENVKHTFTPK